MKITRKTWTVFFIMMLSLFLAACSDKGETSGKDASKEAAAQTITVDELQSNLEKRDWIVVDTRISDAFNGPALDGVERDGHIKGAVDFSVDLLADNTDERQLEAILKYKDITSDKNVVLYDATGKDVKVVTSFLADKGFKNLYTFDVNEWASNPDLPMEIAETCCPVSK